MATNKGKGVNGNLIPVNQRSPSERKKIQSKGGKNSAINRRNRRKIADCVKLLMELDAPESTKKGLKDMGIADEDMSNGMLAVVRMYKEVLNGNVGAFRALLDAEKESTVVNATIETDALSKALMGIAEDIEKDVE